MSNDAETKLSGKPVMERESEGGWKWQTVQESETDRQTESKREQWLHSVKGLPVAYR